MEAETSSRQDATSLSDERFAAIAGALLHLASGLDGEDARVPTDFVEAREYGVAYDDIRFSTREGETLPPDRREILDRIKAMLEVDPDAAAEGPEGVRRGCRELTGLVERSSASPQTA